MVSLFASGLSYQLAYQFVRMLTGESAKFRPWEIEGFRLPSTLFYMNRDGLSYKFRSGYRLGEWQFPFAVEHIFQGDTRTEITLGAERDFENITAAVEATVGSSFEVTMDVRYRLNNWLTFSGGYALYEKRNLHGERVIPSLEHGPTFHDIYLRTSLVY